MLAKIQIIIRSIIFNIFMILFTCLYGVLCSPSFFLPKSSPIFQKIGIFWAKILRLSLEKICNLHLNVKGIDNIPKGNFIIGSKHQSALDIIALIEILKLPIFIMKRSLIFVPIIGIFSYKIGMILIDRAGGTKTLKFIIRKTQELIKQKHNILIFPEGTRTAFGDSAQYKSGLFAIYNQCNVPVLPVALNTGLFWGKNSFIKKPGIYTIEFLPIIEPGIAKEEFNKKLENIIESACKKLGD